jgi:hypothetical protein
LTATRGIEVTKFKIKMKLTGLELDIEGSREDIPLIAANLGQQLTGLLGPAAAIAAGTDESTRCDPAWAPLPMVDEVKKRRKRATTPRSVDTQPDAANAPIDFRHDPAKFGTPKQSWKTSDKAVWLMHVVAAELSGAVIVATFNKHFRQAGTITVGNSNRDLGRLKSKSPAVVGEDTTRTPPRWFLTEEGTRQAMKLVADALGRSSG